MKNKVILLNYSFDWRSVPLAAWASTGVSFEELSSLPVEARMDYLFNQVKDVKANDPEGLVAYLIREGHTSPFRHCTLTFGITSDIATHIHLLKHRVGVEINSESARYKRLSDTYYVPEDLPANVQEVIETHNRLSQHMYTWIYNELISAGYSKQRAKEASRYVLPYSKQITYMMTLSLQALSHLYQLRTSSHAQLEVSLIAQSMLDEVIATGKFDPVIPFIIGDKSWS